MTAVLEAFLVIGAVIAVGAVVGRTDVLGDNARTVLNRIAFHIGLPALLLVTLADASLDQIFSLSLTVSALVVLGMLALCFAVEVLVYRRRRGDAVIGAWAASYANAGNLGIPLSAYVFGGSAEMSALVLFQCIVVIPIGIAILNSETAPAPPPHRQLLALIANPVVAGSIIGLVLASTGFHLPRPINDTVTLLADLAIPTVLIAFGISLTSRSEGIRRSNGAELVLVVVLKNVVTPLLAYAAARWCFDATPREQLLITVMAALPAAQNINAYAAVYRRNEGLARDATLLTTVLSVPIIVAVVALISID